jgi:hypothetical protein
MTRAAEAVAQHLEDRRRLRSAPPLSRSLEVHIRPQLRCSQFAGAEENNMKADLAAVQLGTTTNSVGGQFAPGLDGLPNPAVAIGAVDLAPPSCGPCCRALSLCTRHRPQPSSPL